MTQSGHEDSATVERPILHTHSIGPSLAGTSADVNLSCQHAVTIGSATNPTLSFDMPQCYLMDVSTLRKVKDLVLSNDQVPRDLQHP
jgi:hypothetical protein